MTDRELQSLTAEVNQMRVLLRNAIRGDGSPKWVRAELFCELTGYSEETVRKYRKNGTWPDGVMTKVVARRIHVNLRAYDQWVDTGRVPLAA